MIIKQHLSINHPREQIPGLLLSSHCSGEHISFLKIWKTFAITARYIKMAVDQVANVIFVLMFDKTPVLSSQSAFKVRDFQIYMSNR